MQVASKQTCSCIQVDVMCMPARARQRCQQLRNTPHSRQHRITSCCNQSSNALTQSWQPLVRPNAFLQKHTWHPAALQPGWSVGSSRGDLVRMRVFDKIRELLNGGASGWAGPPADPAENAAAEQGEEQGAEMVRIDTDSSGGLGGTSEDVFGPLAVLLVGFMQHELNSFRTMMNDMDADIVKLVPCTKAMMQESLLAAMHTAFPAYEQPPLGQRRALFFSGMYGSEITEVIAAYRDAGLPPCVFAALVPNNADRTVAELLEAVWKDHAAMMTKLQQKQQPNTGVADSY